MQSTEMQRQLAHAFAAIEAAPFEDKQHYWIRKSQSSLVVTGDPNDCDLAPRTLRFFHGTSWSRAKRIMTHGFSESSEGCLGPGIYVARLDKALRFARDRGRHGEAYGGSILYCLQLAHHFVF